jgi:hypothetical protein
MKFRPAILLVSLLLLAWLVAPADAAEGRLGPATLTIPGTKLACFHRHVRRFTGERQPSDCDIAGYEGEDRKSARFTLRGIKWEKWGSFRSLTSLLSDFPKQTGVYRVVAFRRVECQNRQVWYSRAIVLDRRGNIHVLRLPTCKDTGIVP